MAGNYVLLQRISLTTSTASVTFSSIPQTGYTDLKIVMSSALTVGDVDNVITLNTSVTKSSGLRMYGNGTNKASDTAVGGGLANGSTYTANTFSSTEYYFPNYTSSVNKGVSIDAVTENNGTQSYLNISSQIFNLTSGITSIKLTPNSGSYAQYSTFSLYGIAAVGATPVTSPYASGGDIIQTDGTYWYHAFLSSGLFIPTKGLSCDYLVVGGGGAGGAADSATGGGGNWSGGGGSGGLRSTLTTTGGGGSLESPLSLTANTSYTITIGAGGTAAAAGWTNGNSTTFSSVISKGGGAGSGLDTIPSWTVPGDSTNGAATGGGGSEGNNPTTYGVSGQGYAGGSAAANSGGGGGGAGAVGNAGSTNAGGVGGAGVSLSVFASATGTGVSNYYAGGGGGSGQSSGGAGGAGGGGAGSTGGATAGTANTGGGGGSGSRSGATGGSGIVIIRYAV